MPGADDRFMALALSLGRRNLGQTWPNPAVGCVIVRDGRIVGRGWTGEGGRPHAETIALAQAGEAATGATAYVTLEPCAHHGKTPPCAAALVASGIIRVVSALEDPDPRVAGAGHRILRQSGIAVDTGLMADAAKRDHAGFLLRQTAARPHLTLKLATSFDGRIATRGGESRWITGADARRRVHLMRASHDAVLIGAGTARADNPALTVRGLGIKRQPLRVVFDTNLGTPETGALGQSAAEVPVWMCHGPAAPPERRDAWARTGARLLECACDTDGRVGAQAALAKLAEAGLTRVFCEGGGTLAAALLAAGQVDTLVGFTAGLVLGGDARAAIAPLAFPALADHPRFHLGHVEIIGGDVLHIWHRTQATSRPYRQRGANDANTP